MPPPPQVDPSSAVWGGGGGGAAVWVLLGAACVIALSGVPGLFAGRRSAAGERIATVLHLIGAGAGFVSVFLAGLGWAGTPPPALSVAWLMPWSRFSIAIDGLSAAFLVPMLIVPAMGSVFGLRYWRQAEHPENGRQVRLFYGLLAASLLLVVTARDGIVFLIAWEVVTLSSFVLVATEDEQAEARDAAWVYFVAAHVATLCLFGMFALLGRVTGTFALEPVASGAAGLGTLSAIFLLALVAFGVKAGVMPLHVWLPGAHAAAPSHVSAVMSGVVIKTGIYGLARIASMLPDPPAFWGSLVLVLGVVSGVLGVAFAIGQHDLKRLLAYHSIENIGIIMIGLGLAMIGRAMHRPEWVMLGLAGAVLHVWNHALFKSLLFLSAGSVVHAVGTRQIDRMGGLGRAMPGTAMLFLIGAVAICGLPPLNGFVSELLIYLGLFQMVGQETVAGAAGAALGALGGGALAMIGALAVACFVKVYGAVFLGNARSDAAARAHEAPPSILAPMVVLAGCCVLIGLAPAVAVPMLERAAGSWIGDAGAALPRLASLLPLWWVSAGGVALVGLAAVAYGPLRRAMRPAGAKRVLTWDCGYAAPSARMQYTSSSLAQMLVRLFAWALRPHEHRPRLRRLFPKRARFHSHVGDTVLDRWMLPALRAGARAAVWFRVLQRGRIQFYILYVLVALAALIVSIVPLLDLVRSIVTR